MSDSVHDNIETIESGYEYLLAYAAQGRETEKGSETRSVLSDMSDAASAITDLQTAQKTEFSEVVVTDAKNAGAAIRLVLSQDTISSELVDNLNASIHLRALLTDLFLLSETAERSG